MKLRNRKYLMPVLISVLLAITASSVVWGLYLNLYHLIPSQIALARLDTITGGQLKKSIDELLWRILAQIGVDIAWLVSLAIFIGFYAGYETCKWNYKKV